MAQGNEILDDIKVYLNSCNHVTMAANENVINDLHDSVELLLHQLNIVFSSLCLRHRTLMTADLVKFEDANKQVVKLWAQLDLSYTPKFHPCYAVPLMKKHSGFHEMLEDDIEKSHQDIDHIHWRLTQLGCCAKYAISISRRIKTRSNPSVQTVATKANEGSKRRQQGHPKQRRRRKL